MTDSICFTPAIELARKIRGGDLTSEAVVDAFLERIDNRDDSINAFIELTAADARKRARELDKAARNGDELGPLHGVPVAIKDLEDVAGVRTTYGSVPFRDHIAKEDSVVVKRLKKAGAVILGKTNVPEFGHKGTTDNRIIGPTSTPFDIDRNAGGSSGGSAAAVADGMAALALGSDGGGSIRIPSSFCGIFGMKPTFRRIARPARPNAFGNHTPFSQLGPHARSVEDAALMIEVMAGEHNRDPFSLPDDGTDYLAAPRYGIQDVDIAYSPDLNAFPVEESVAAIVHEAVKTFRSAGANVDEINPEINHSASELSDAWLTMGEAGLAQKQQIYKNEYSIDLLGDHIDELNPVVADRIENGASLSAVDYKNADLIRTEVFDAIQDLLERYDLLLSPTVSIPPILNDSDDTTGPEEINGTSVGPLDWVLTHPFNFSGHPAASLPAGFTDDGLPVGLQIVGRRYDDERVLAASAAFERIAPWKDAYPPSGR